MRIGGCCRRLPMLRLADPRARSDTIGLVPILPVRVLSGSLLALFALSCISVQPAAARDDARLTVEPLPAADYSVRPVCATRRPGEARCLAAELVPQTPAARAHTHPLGMARSRALRAGRLAEVCSQPTAAKGCYGLIPQEL
jgi:hypothetical protein